MSTIASPRDGSGPFPRRTNSSIITPTSSTRPSLDMPASASGSPNPSASSTPSAAASAAAAGTGLSQSKRANRAALREYYNLRNNAAASNKPLPSTPPPIVVEESGSIPSSPSPLPLSTNPSAPSFSSSSSSDPASDPALDAPDFDAPAYVARLLETGTLAELLGRYARVLAEMRALDAERKALVYDNYSKLIAATETIRRMRTNSSSGGSTSSGNATGIGVGWGGREEQGKEQNEQEQEQEQGGLEKLVEGIYQRAVEVREELRKTVGAPPAPTGDTSGRADGGGAGGNRERTRELAREVLRVPGRLRRLVEEGRPEEARREWEVPRRLLVRWQELGVGGEDVGALIEEGDAALRGADT